MPKRTDNPTLTPELQAAVALASGVAPTHKLASALIMAALRVQHGWVTVYDASVYLGVDEHTIYQFIKDGAISTSKRGARHGRLLRADDVIALAHHL